MKKLLGPIVLMIVSAGLAVLFTKWTLSASLKSEYSLKADRLQMQMEFLRNNAILQPITDSQGKPDLQKYLQNVNDLFAWYQNNAVSKFLAAHPEAADPERFIKQKRAMAEQEGPNQKVAKANLQYWEEAYAMVRKVYDAFKQGNYQAVASGFQGSVRFDVVSVEKHEGKLKWTFMVWGGIGSIVYDGWNMKLFKSPTEEEKREYEKELARARRKGREPEIPDPATLSFGESASTAKHPSLSFEVEGAEMIDGFPPGALLNYYYTPLIAEEAEKLLIKFKLKSHAVVGSDQELAFEFELPARAEWKGSWAGVRKVEAASDYK